MSYKWTIINNEATVLVKNKVLDVTISRQKKFFLWHNEVLVKWSYKTTGDILDLEDDFIKWEKLNPNNENDFRKVNNYLTEKHLDIFFSTLENTSLLKQIYKELIFKTHGVKIIEFRDKTSYSITTIIKEINRMVKLLNTIKQ